MKRFTPVLLLLAQLAASGAYAQSYPTKPVRIVLGFTPGGGVDINARSLSPELTKQFGHQFIVDNRPRAGTNIANEYVAKAPPDGYTRLMNTAAIAINTSHVKSKRLRALANAGTKRADQMPDVPTLKESGVNGVEVVVWYGVLAPVATPRDIVNSLATAIAKVIRSPEMRQRLIDQGAEPVGNTPEQFSKLMHEEVTRWAAVVKVSGAKAD